MHTKNVRMRPVPLWGRCTGSTDFTSRKKNTRKTNGATKQHSMRDQRQLWKSFSSSFASFEFTWLPIFNTKALGIVQYVIFNPKFCLRVMGA